MRSALILIAALSPAQADVPTGGRTIPCYCTDTVGARVELGALACLNVDGRAFMARCEMALNVPIWRDTGDGCLSSRLQGGADPLAPPLQSGAIDAEVALSET